ncbi:hypothetical protein EH228_01175 [Erwinia endophytica]|uniref:hypothetical protein n=1 Tax=Erwinia endophytica TaxID=1563158 RepID=UPI001265E4A8|nr:hypothetical protein [Erwinia endophytica]KAB8313689.1 hypothetical protein EH228_01175 [Erwinia endophytica]
MLMALASCLFNTISVKVSKFSTFLLLPAIAGGWQHHKDEREVAHVFISNSGGSGCDLTRNSVYHLTSY